MDANQKGNISFFNSIGAEAALKGQRPFIIADTQGELEEIIALLDIASIAEPKKAIITNEANYAKP